MLEDVFQIAVFRVCLAVSAALLVALALVGLRKAGRLLLRRLKPVALAALLPLAALLTDFAGEKGTNMPQRVVQPGASQAFSYCGAVTNAEWLARGAYEDWFRIPATNWWARTADGWLDGVTVFAWCEFRPDIRTTNAYPRPFLQKLSLAPMANWNMLANATGGTPVVPVNGQDARYPSLFWHGVSESNTLVMTWQNGLYARCATNLVSFQAELFNDGSVAYRYDGSPVATNDFVVPLELPFDRDGDGLENSVDPEPDVAGPDAHGTNAEWYNTVCSNVLEMVEGGDTGTTGVSPVGGGHGVPALPWREGVNSNAYYFVDVVAERGPAPIRFMGDRTSRLGNPAVVALAGETNRVPLLIGIDYAVTSDTPFTVSFPADYMYPEVETNEPCVARIHWPLEFHFVETNVTGTARIYRVDVTPFDPGGAFSWETAGGSSSGGLRSGGCSCVSYAGRSVVFDCSAECKCGGSCAATGTYSFECVTLPVTGGVCRCGFDDPGTEGSPVYVETNGPSFSIDFSKDAVIFEDAYQDSDGRSVAKRSTRVRLTVSAYGGTRGGSFVLAPQNLGKLSAVAGGQINLPPFLDLAARESFYTTCVYEGEETSQSEDEISVAGYFIENETGTRINGSDTLTAVLLVVTPERPFPLGCPCRHTFGVCESMTITAYPNTLRAFTWDSSGMVLEGRRSNNAQDFQFMLDEGSCAMTFMFKGVSYTVNTMCLRPHNVTCLVSPTILPGNAGVGQSGGVGMYMELTLMPSIVDFAGLQIMERITNDGLPEGYFDHEYFRPWWNHGMVQGAGVLREIGIDNHWYDTAIMEDVCPELQSGGWTAGSITWMIPIAWREKQGFSISNGWINFVIKEQRSTIDAVGTVGVEKFDWRVERDVQGRTNIVQQVQGVNGP